MNTLQNGLWLASLCTAVGVLPFVPTLLTRLRGPRVGQTRQTLSDASVQCENFRRLIEHDFASLINLARKNGTIRSANDHGQPFIVLGFQSNLVELLAPGSKRLRSCVIASGHLDIPGELICDREIFAEGQINVAPHAVVKSLLSHRDIAIGPRARVTRWARSDRRLDVAEGACIKGWASAGIEIALARRACFQKVLAPQIRFGRQQDQTDPRHNTDTTGRFEPPVRSGARPGNGHDLQIPAGHAVKEDLILSGVLVIGDGCHIIGQIRAEKGIRIGADVRIDGAIHANGGIEIGPRSCISGPVVSNGKITVAQACVFGSTDEPCTLSAETIMIGEGCVAHGTVHALCRGEVIAERNAP
jgi:cytoskeletal protein CcmA (bactofilin family)